MNAQLIIDIYGGGVDLLVDCVALADLGKMRLSASRHQPAAQSNAD